MKVWLTRKDISLITLALMSLAGRRPGLSKKAELLVEQINPAFADFMRKYGDIKISAPDKSQGAPASAMESQA